MRRYIDILRAQPRPFRFLISRLLMRSGLCRRIVYRRNGYRLRFHPTALSAVLWVHPEDRLREERFLQACLSPGDTVIDIGANIGTISLACARAVGATGRVLAIEPHPRIHAALSDNVALNGFSGLVETHQVALGNETGSISLTDTSDDTQTAVAGSDGGASIPVRMARLDAIAPEGPVALMKLDTEGYEPNIIAGAVSVCARTAILYSEFDPHLIRRHGGDPGCFIDTLRQSGFRLFALGRDGLMELGDVPGTKSMLVALRAGDDALIDRVRRAAGAMGSG